jgi:hypothetical protein
MASLNKQQKRAKRAKAKAKQQHVAHNHQPQFGDSHASDYMNLMSTEKGPGAAVDWSLYDDEEDEADISDEDLAALLGTVDETELHDMMLEQFSRMKEAESISRVAMFIEFLRGPAGIIAFAIEEGEPMADELLSMLVAYQVWAHGTDPDVAVSEILDPAYTDDFTTAMDTVAQEFDALLEDPDLWDDDFVK